MLVLHQLNKEMIMFAFLKSPCVDCKNPDCEHAVKARKGGEFFITFGHAGFNSVANNNFGYKTEANARKAIARYVAKAKAAYPFRSV